MDGFAVIDLGVKIVSKYFKNQEKGLQFERVILYNIVLSVLLITSNYLAKDEILILRDPILRLWSDSLDMMVLNNLSF